MTLNVYIIKAYSAATQGNGNIIRKKTSQHMPNDDTILAAKPKSLKASQYAHTQNSAGYTSMINHKMYVHVHYTHIRVLMHALQHYTSHMDIAVHMYMYMYLGK